MPEELAVCMRCHDGQLVKFMEDGKDLFRCARCGHVDDRVMATSGIQIEWLQPWVPKHHSVGALITAEDRFLIIHRRVWPYKHGVPAGHVDEGEDPHGAVIREVAEELGSHVTAATPIAHEPHLVGDRCRKGADVHAWTLFACSVDPLTVTNNSDEASAIRWVTNEEAAELDFAFASGHMLRSVGRLPQQ